MSKLPIKEIGRKRLPLDKLEPMPRNREYGSGMSAKSLTELANSIAEVGIQQDILVREHPDPAKAKKGWHQIIAGTRRHAAALKAEEKTKVSDAPCKIVEADDTTALELRAIENLQRENLHELEEAGEFQQLLDLREHDQPVHTWDSIAKKVGKSAAYVRARVKLLDMPDLAKEAFLKKKLSASNALLICRIPDAAQALKATIELLDPVWKKAENALSDEHEPMSHRQAKKHIQDTYMRRLKGSVFDQEDATLVPEFDKDGQDYIPGTADSGANNGQPVLRAGGGACSTCPCRTANMKALYPDLASEDVCTNTTCFALKEKAHQKRAAAKFAAQGQTLLKPKQAEKVVNSDGTLTWQGREKFLPLNAKVEGSKKTVGEILEKAGIEHEVVVAQTAPEDGKPKTVPLVPIGEAVVKALNAAGVAFEPPKAAQTPEQRQQLQDEVERRRQINDLAIVTIREQTAKAIRLAKNAEDVRAMVLVALFQHGDQPLTVKAAKKLDEREAWALLFEDQCLFNPFTHHGELQPAFAKIVGEFGVDAKQILKDAEKAAKTEDKK